MERPQSSALGMNRSKNAPYTYIYLKQIEVITIPSDYQCGIITVAHFFLYACINVPQVVFKASPVIGS